MDGIDGFICKCSQDDLHASHCGIDLNECASNPCKGGSTCQDRVNGYLCLCVPGYTGVLCDEEVDECSSDPCLNGGTCTDMVNGFNCACQPGYTGQFT